MSHPEEYDVVVLGSGAAGKLLAWTLASRGQRVAVSVSVSNATDRDRPKSTQRCQSGRKASVAFISMNVAKASFNQMPFHHFMVTRSPNHMWAISWWITSATRCNSGWVARSGSTSSADMHSLAAWVRVQLAVTLALVPVLLAAFQQVSVVSPVANAIARTPGCSVKGLSTDVPFREDGNLVMGATTKGRWSYACSKAIDEFLALAYWREKKLPTTIVRLFNTVGPRQTGRYGMVIPTFVKQALAGRPITVYGDGKQTRCFGYVGDVVGALIRLMDHAEAVGQVFNIGSTEEISIVQLAEKVKALTGSDSEIIFVPYNEAYEEGFEDMPRRIPDISKIRQLVGFQPQMRLDGILESVISFHSGSPSSLDD